MDYRRHSPDMGVRDGISVRGLPSRSRLPTRSLRHGWMLPTTPTRCPPTRFGGRHRTTRPEGEASEFAAETAGKQAAVASQGIAEPALPRPLPWTGVTWSGHPGATTSLFLRSTTDSRPRDGTRSSADACGFGCLLAAARLLGGQAPGAIDPKAKWKALLVLGKLLPGSFMGEDPRSLTKPPRQLGK